MKYVIPSWLAGLSFCLSVSPLYALEPTAGPELKEGDRVAFIGNAFFEREGRYGHIETALTVRYADRNVTFRNLGWSGDTVWCTARAYFGTPKDGFKHLMEHVDLVKPTVIMLAYGGNEAFAGEAGLPRFIEGYNRLLDELEKRTKRIILISPTPYEYRPPPRPDNKKINEHLKLYGDAIRKLAAERGYLFIDLYDPWIETFSNRNKRGALLTDNGIHLTGYGYRTVSEKLANSFSGGEATPPQSQIKRGDISDIRERLFAALESLRKAIIEKNEMFFHRHRPQNETYLRGFRKYEQGNNAVEIAKFEPLVEQKEKEIAQIRQELIKFRAGVGNPRISGDRK